MSKGVLAIALALAMGPVAPAGATTNLQECAEAAQFIGNAARARDAGMSREDFLAHMQADFELIHAFPPPLRWFAETEADERFLLDAASEVFDRPLPPEVHAARFARACASRADV